MTIRTVSKGPFAGQKPGTSGLRKKTRVFMEPGYLECFVQATFNAIGGASGKTFVVGGDGRFFNREAIQTIIKMAAANGAARVIVGQGGLMSTPAVSHMIRLRGTDGGLVLSASHNPGGIDEDFGVKYNVGNGGPAPENITAAMYEETTKIDRYTIFDAPDVDLGTCGEVGLGGMSVEIVDPVADYARLMESLFDFDRIADLFRQGFTMRFDAMHAVTGPYAKAILEGRLGAAPGTVINAVPSEDFGGGHPDPNPVWAAALMAEMMSQSGTGFRCGLGWRWRSQHDPGTRCLCHAVGQLGGAGRQRASGTRIFPWPRGGGTVHADQRGGGQGGRSARHRLPRDADRMEVLR